MSDNPRREAGEKAIEALAALSSVHNLGDFIYTIRENEGLGWDGPLVKRWGEACDLAEYALDIYNDAASDEDE